MIQLENMKEDHSIMSELQTVLDRTVQFVTEMLPADGCSVVLWDEENKRFTTSASTIPKQDKQLTAQRVRTSGGATRWIVDNRQPFIVTDVRNDPFSANKILGEYNLQAYIGVPLVTDKGVAGVLYAMSIVPREYLDYDVQLLENCADIIGLTISKSQAVDDLEQANKALELYVRTVTHDIKSPLSIAMGYLNLVTSEYSDLEDEEKQEFLIASEQMLAKSFQIIDELLLLTEIRNEHAIPFTPINMSAVISEVEKRMRPLLDEANATIEIPTQWEHQVVGYSPWIEEIWVNFISNAIKYGGTPPVIEITSTQTELGIQFWTKDNGNGLTQEQQETLFEPFTRFNSTRIQGHGLGLSIVRHITERMNGTVGVDSEVGQGSEFYFTLPTMV